MMTYATLVLALLVGYVIGLMQKGITIKHVGEDKPTQYHKGVGADYYKEYYEKTNGVNKF